VTFQHVIDTIRDPAADNENYRRLLFLEPKDLHNVTRDFNIDYSTKRHKNDAISVKLWVNEMKALTESPILYFKGQDEDDGLGEQRILKKEDFALIITTDFQGEQLKKFGLEKICIDGTHGTNGYDIIQLYTMMTVDELGSGCPVAFCFSNRSDEVIFKLFFEKIKVKVGIINGKVFMSDDAPAFYNAWSGVMGSVTHQLLCSWHVNKNWQENLNKVSGGPEKKKLVSQTLRVLMHQTSVQDFQNHLSKFIKDLISDDDTNAFGIYFVKYYARRPKLWAYCFRLMLGINTNMYLESFHKILKHIYLEGRKVKRLDKTINALMKICRDSVYKRLIHLAKNVPTEKMQKVRQSHKASESIKLDQIQVLEDGAGYLMTSSSDPSRQYHILKAGETCEHASCLKCRKCNICIHSYHCDCLDNVIRVNICKHIHACAREFNEVIDDCGYNINHEASVVEQQMLLEMNTSPIIVNKNRKIQSQAELILGLSQNNFDDQDREKIEKKMLEVITFMNAATKKIILKPVANINSQQKIIVPQTRLYSTKKKRKCRDPSIPKPTINEFNAIVSGLENDNSESINIHSTFDHSYV